MTSSKQMQCKSKTANKKLKIWTSLPSREPDWDVKYRKGASILHSLQSPDRKKNEPTQTYVLESYGYTSRPGASLKD